MKRRVLTATALTVAAAFLALGGCSKSNPAGPGGGSGNQVVISNFAYSSPTVSKGTTVTWKNNDSTAHTATADASSTFQFDTGNIPAGGTSSGVTFTQAGTFAYHCAYHSSMHGTITVQ